jgi:GT2 family glycosyltransferase
LESIALQQPAGQSLEVVVADDGSDDGTAELVDRLAATLPLSVRFTSQPHDGFRLARLRNAAARLARGRYLLFLDGDCMLPPGHVAAHVARRRHGTALIGYCARLSRQASDLLVPENLPLADLALLVPEVERRSLARRHRKAWWHNAARHPTKPRLAGGDFGIWREDFVRVNGFDERFVGWGQEDDDLGLRLRAAGVRLESILDATCSLHIWHPTDPTAARRWRDGPNVAYFGRRGRLTACRHGIEERPPRTVTWGLPGDVHATEGGRAVARLLADCPLVGPGRPRSRGPRTAGCCSSKMPRTWSPRSVAAPTGWRAWLEAMIPPCTRSLPRWAETAARYLRFSLCTVCLRSRGEYFLTFNFSPPVFRRSV